MKYVIHLNSDNEQRVNDFLTIEADEYIKSDNFITFWKNSKIVLDIKASAVYYIKAE